ncbi:DEAD/DEAH box helicase [Clostridium baratii]|uniref:DEAD/DEAH box helicase n=1 Tax=Clostridium baratii TaxID=1561 RepID=UPI0030CBAA33
MVDFRARLKNKKLEKKINPLEIYDNLDRKSETGPLRPVQEKILNEWYEKRKDDKDLIIKLHTGMGKTLIGLLILQSKLNSNEGPCLYVCPNKYLAKQVCLEAEKFGINYCVVGKSDLPNEFLKGESILITHVQKVFNGKTIFGMNNNAVKIGSIILDDSHTCIDAINNSFTISIRRETNKIVYEKILSLFRDDLKEQGEGTLIDIESGEYSEFLPIPYWAWDEKKSYLLKILAENKDSDGIEFVWPLIKDNIDFCRGFIDGTKIEISPYKIPISIFNSFHGANNRILMSATTQNDAFFINGLDFDVKAVKEPLEDKEILWSGEKMIIIPSLIDEECSRSAIIAFIGKFNTKFGVLSIVPSFEKGKGYEHYGVKLVKENFFESINMLKNTEIKKPIVIANRYDGIDLPDNACRLLVIDSLPYADSLADRYQEVCISNSEIINIKIAQKIEQGLGRSVRGEKDYSAILLIGEDLVKFVNSINTKGYFSNQTQKQIDIGFDIANMAKEDIEDDRPKIDVVSGLIMQSLKRDDGWKEYYEEEMNKIEKKEKNDNIHEILALESASEKLYQEQMYDAAIRKIQLAIDKISDENEKSWYIQQLARYTYKISVVESNIIQTSAFRKNKQLLKPKEGVNYEKIEYINENRTKKIRNWLRKFENYTEMSLSVDCILSNLSFGVQANDFEQALYNVGELLGFESQRPDKMIRKGPDNLWCIDNNEYILFECKSEVQESRKEISKTESGQMNNHCAWFKNQYGDAKVRNILIIPTNKLSYEGDFSYEVGIMRRNKLNELKRNIKGFVKEIKKYDIHNIGDEKISEFLLAHKLDKNNLINNYYESYRHNIK